MTINLVQAVSCLCPQFGIALIVEDCDWRLFSPELDTIGGGSDLNALQDAEAEWLRAERSADPNDDSSRPSRPGHTRRISGCSTFVPIVQTAYLRHGDDFARGGRRYRSGLWAILVECDMSSGIVIISKLGRQDATQMRLIEDGYTVEALTAN